MSPDDIANIALDFWKFHVDFASLANSTSTRPVKISADAYVQVPDARPACEARLKTVTPKAIDRYLQRLLAADSLAAVFDD